MHVARQPASPGEMKTGSDHPFKLVLWLSIGLLFLTMLFVASRGISAHDSVFKTGYGFGPQIKALVEHHQFGASWRGLGYLTRASRMPVIPLLGFASYLLSPRLIVFFILKNLLFFSIWAYALWRLGSRGLVRPKWLLVSACLLLAAPYNLSIFGKVEVEEGYLLQLLVLLFVLLLTAGRTRDYVAIGVVVAGIYLTKSSMLLVCVVAALWTVAIMWRRNRFATLLPALCLALAIAGWGIYIYELTGVVAVGVDSSSTNGGNFYKANNLYAYDLYPRTNLDNLDRDAAANGLLPRTPFHNEWELSHQQLALGEVYAKEHKSEVFKMDLKKAYVACCDVKESPEFIPGHTRTGVLFSNALNHLLVFAVLVCAANNLYRRRITQAEVLALLFAVAYLVPYVAGFLYMRHMVPLYALAGFVAASQLAEWERRRQRERSVSSPVAAAQLSRRAHLNPALSG